MDETFRINKVEGRTGRTDRQTREREKGGEDKAKDSILSIQIIGNLQRATV